MDNYGAIIFAVNMYDSEAADFAPDGCKSLIEINGKPAISYVLDALKSSQSISRIALIGSSSISNYVSGPDLFLEATESEAGNVISAVPGLGDVEKCLLLSGDIALISPEAINDLLINAPDSDVIYPVISEEDMSNAYPEQYKYYVKTRDGHFTGSSLLLFKRDAALNNQDLIRKLLNARQNPMELMPLVGTMFAMRLLMGSVSINEIESQISKNTGLDVRVYISHYPELFVSIDTKNDIQLIERSLGTI